MGFNWVFLNPIHYPGFSGSLYATKDHRRLNARFLGPEESGRSDEEVITAFVADARAHGLSVMLDLVINHTSKDSLLVDSHPEWFKRDADGELVSPGAVDLDAPTDPDKITTWGDLAALDYSERPALTALVDFWKDLVRYYVGLGIRGLRCDAAYKVPADIWHEIISAARAETPDVQFYAENVGSFFEEVEALRPAGFNYLFNSSKWWDFRAPWLLEQYETFRHIAPSVAFPESHDTPRLAADLLGFGLPDSELETAMVRHYMFAASFSSGVMMPIGYEYGFTHPLHVVDTNPDQWEPARFDISRQIAAINAMKAENKSLCAEGPVHRIDSPTGALGLLREAPKGGHRILTAINPPGNGPWTLETGDDDPLAVATRGYEEITPCRKNGAEFTNGTLTLEDGEIRIFRSVSSKD